MPRRAGEAGFLSYPSPSATSPGGESETLSLLWHESEKQEGAEHNEVDEPVQDVGAARSEGQHTDEKGDCEKQRRLAVETENELLTQDHGGHGNGWNGHSNRSER